MIKTIAPNALKRWRSLPPFSREYVLHCLYNEAHYDEDEFELTLFGLSAV